MRSHTGLIKLALGTAFALAVALALGSVGSTRTSAQAAGAAPADTAKVKIGKWVPTLEAGITLTQGSYSNNWAGGDQGSIVWTYITNATLTNQLDPKVNWASTLKLAYGQTHQQVRLATGERIWDSPAKSTDLIDLESVMRFTLGGFVDPFVSGHFESQFQDKSDPLGRGLSINPRKYTESAGIARKMIDEPDRSLLSRVGFAFKQNTRKSFVNAVAASDHTTESEMTNDGGIEWVTNSKTSVLRKRVTWTSKLTVYQPVFYSGKKALKDLSADSLAAYRFDPDLASFTTKIGSDWENIFSSQITKLISVNLYTRWVYQKYDASVKPLPLGVGGLSNPDAVRAAIRKAGQFKETLAIGFTYRFL